MFRMTSLLVCLLLFKISLAVPLALGGTTYYVDTKGSDTNPGTQELPWKTVQHAVTQVQAGDTVLINPGNYSSTEQISITTDGESGKPITFKGNGSGVVIDSSAYPGRNGFEVFYADYITIENLEIKSSLIDSQSRGLRVTHSNYVTIRDNIVHNAGHANIFCSFSDHILIENNKAYDGDIGIYVADSTDYPIVRGNTLHDNNSIGLHMNGDINSGGDGIISYALVENNISCNNGATGINCDGVQESTFRNNLIYNNGQRGLVLFRIDGAEPSNNNEVYHNTIKTLSSAYYVLGLNYGSTQNKIYNNILLAEGSVPSISANTDQVQGLESNYNIFVTHSRAIEIGSTFLTFQQWQTKGYDQNSIQATIEEVFVDVSQNNYHLNDYSPCIGAGITTPAAPKTDIEGNPRPNPPGSNPDIGAYEHFRDVPLAVTLASLTASSTTDSITLRWRTASETNNLGFNIYRSDAKDGKYIKVNPKLIQGAGTDSIPHEYSFTDNNVKFGQIYYYYIEDIDFAGKKGKSPIPVKIKVGQKAEVKVIDNSHIIVPSKFKPIVIPTEFALLQNFPNPFNPETWIPYHLPQNAKITIRIYNANGQIVRKLSVGNRSMGSYVTKESAAYWDARDSLGQQVTSGMYFYTLQVGEFRATRKMVVQK